MESPIQNTVDWDGPNDPDNPMNWSTSRKISTLTCVISMRLITPFPTFMMPPALLVIQDEFHTTNNVLVIFTISGYLIGFGFGALLLGALSEIYGRNIQFHATNVLYIALTAASGAAPSIQVLTSLRILCGFAGASSLVTGAGTIADIAPPNKRSLALAFFNIGLVLEPTIAPVIGGVLTDAMGWRWIFWIMTILSGLITLLSAIFVRETYAPRLLAMKAARLRQDDENLGHPIPQAVKDPRKVFFTSINRPIDMILHSPIVFGLTMYFALIYGVLYLVLTSLSSVYYKQYGLHESEAGLPYIGLSVGNLIGFLITGLWTEPMFRFMKGKRQNKPEVILPTIFFLSIIMLTGMMLYGWAAQERLHWIVPIIGCSIFTFGLAITIANIQKYLTDAFTTYISSATAATNFVRSLASALLPLSGLSLYDKIGLGWGNSLLGFVLLIFSSPFLVFFWYRKEVRGKYATD